MERFRLKKIIFILLLLNSSFVLADQKDSRLNSLFDELFLSNDNMQASTILADIWDIWSIVENVEAQEIFDEGNNMMDRGSLEEAITLFTQVIDLKPDFAKSGLRSITWVNKVIASSKLPRSIILLPSSNISWASTFSTIDHISQMSAKIVLACILSLLKNNSSNKLFSRLSF